MWTAPIKLIIWDLDDTLWRGTLADGEAVTLFDARARMIHAFNARGVVSSICSKNDPAAARAQLEAFGLWDALVFPHIAFTPKPQAVAAIIADMQLRPANVLFVDDNPQNLLGVAHALPEIHTLDAAAADADAQLAGLLALQTGTRSRVADYRILEQKRADRAAAPDRSHRDFLRASQLCACAPFLMDNLEFAPRIAELINRANQLNYTGSRVELDALERAIIDVKRYECWSIFAWDKYGRYGLVGFVMIDRLDRHFVHFTFSCRAMHMGLEAYALARVRAIQPDLAPGAWIDRVEQEEPDWITDCDFHDPAVRARVRADLLPEAPMTPAIRIMFDCQSGGIAHYSRFRPAIEFDNRPRVFRLGMLEDDAQRDQPFPPFLVYGATVDYLDVQWPGRWHLLERGVYERCVLRLVIRLIESDLRLLVVLPPENAPDAKFRHGLNHTPERTRLFNALWRRMARENPGHVWILDLAHLIDDPDEMADVTHYRPVLLQKIAGQLDLWIEQVALSNRGETATADAA